MASHDVCRKYCKECDQNIMAERKGTNHVLHLILSLITAGGWLIIWLLASIKFGGWWCPQCGGRKLGGIRKPKFLEVSNG